MASNQKSYSMEEIKAMCPERRFDARFMMELEENGQKFIQMKPAKLRTEMSKQLYIELNKLWMNFQKGNVNPVSDIREMWYQVKFAMMKRTGLKEPDYGVEGNRDSGKQFITFHGAISDWCEKLKSYYGMTYWGLARDMVLNVRVSDMCAVRDSWGTKILTRENRESVSKSGCFAIVAEKKKTADDLFNSLSAKGYPVVVMNSKGYSVVEMVLTLLEYKAQVGAGDHFYVLSAHDGDVNGILIYLDLQKWFPGHVFSVGVTPKFFEWLKNTSSDPIDFEMAKEPYEPDEEHKTGVENHMKRLHADGQTDVADEVEEMLAMCGTGFRAELNTITGYRKAQGKPEAEWILDLSGWCEHVIEEQCKVWNLMRVASHRVDTPQPQVGNAQDFLEKLVWEPFKKILEKHNRLYSMNWEEPCKDQKEEYIEEDKEYEGDIKNWKQVIKEQNEELTRICMEDDDSSKTVDEIYEKLEKVVRNIEQVFQVVIPRCPKCSAPAKHEYGRKYECIRCDHSFTVEEDLTEEEEADEEEEED